MNQDKEINRVALEDLRVFHTIARSLASSLDLDQILLTILEHMERFIETGTWSLLMLDQEKNELYCAIAGSGHHQDLQTLRFKPSEGVAEWVMQHGQTLIVPENEVPKNAHLLDHGSTVSTIRSVIAMPLKGRTQMRGVIEIINPNTEKLNDYTIAMLHILADYAAIAIDNAQDMARIHELTITDDATGLYNVRYLYSILERELADAKLYKLPLSFAFLDLDRFKLVNDIHGHLAGSELLNCVGQQLRALSRPGDLCFRYGGDEFALLLPHTNLNDAVQHIRQLHATLTSNSFDLSSGARLQINASAGVAAFPQDGTTLHSLIGTADTRMYTVKANGRGRVLGE